MGFEKLVQVRSPDVRGTGLREMVEATPRRTPDVEDPKPKDGSAAAGV